MYSTTGKVRQRLTQTYISYRRTDCKAYSKRSAFNNSIIGLLTWHLVILSTVSRSPHEHQWKGIIRFPSDSNASLVLVKRRLTWPCFHSHANNLHSYATFLYALPTIWYPQSLHLMWNSALDIFCHPQQFLTPVIYSNRQNIGENSQYILFSFCVIFTLLENQSCKSFSENFICSRSEYYPVNPVFICDVLNSHLVLTILI